MMQQNKLVVMAWPGVARCEVYSADETRRNESETSPHTPVKATVTVRAISFIDTNVAVKIALS